MPEHEPQEGCPTHGPFNISGHSAEHCPERLKDKGELEVDSENTPEEIEEKPDFKDFIPLSQEITPAEALKWLYKFFPETLPGVLEEVFPKLNNSGGSAIFEEPTLDRHRGKIKLSGKGSDELSWYYLLDDVTGYKHGKIG